MLRTLLLRVALPVSLIATVPPAARAQSPGPAPASAPSGPTAPTTTSAATAPLRVAVYNLLLDGVSATVGTVVSDSLLAEVRKLQGVSAIGMSEIRDMLSHEASKQLIGCEEDDSCLAEISGALGVDELITGKLARVGDTHVLTLRRLDQRRAVVLGAFDQRLRAERGQEFLVALGPAVARLYPERPLRPGLTRGVADEVAMRLHPPPLPTWSFWAASAVTVVALVATGAAGLYWGLAYADYDRLAHQGSTVDGALLREKETAVFQGGVAAWALLGTSVVLGAATGVMALFVDWWGYGDALAETER